MLSRTAAFPRNRKFRAFATEMATLARRTGSRYAGKHAVLRNERVGWAHNKIGQAPYMPAPPKGYVYARDQSKSGVVPMLVRR